MPPFLRTLNAAISRSPYHLSHAADMTRAAAPLLARRAAYAPEHRAPVNTRFTPGFAITLLLRGYHWRAITRLRLAA